MTLCRLQPDRMHRLLRAFPKPRSFPLSWPLRRPLQRRRRSNLRIPSLPPAFPWPKLKLRSPIRPTMILWRWDCSPASPLSHLRRLLQAILANPSASPSPPSTPFQSHLHPNRNSLLQTSPRPRLISAMHRLLLSPAILPVRPFRTSAIRIAVRSRAIPFRKPLPRQPASPPLPTPTNSIPRTSSPSTPTALPSQKTR